MTALQLRSQPPFTARSYVSRRPRHDGAHIAFRAPDTVRDERWHAAAIDNGGTDNGAPGVRPEYSGRYHAAFALDPDGNNVGAVFHAPVPAGETHS
jgi:catechol 2,3-dioxygenase-like lactoylglutathione lyase family enzyme